MTAAIGPGAGRRGLGLALLVLALTVPALAGRDLWNPNEPAYGEAVREMAHEGNWLVPKINGQVFAEKPILYYWMALAVSSALGGVSEFSLRLPLVLFAIGGALLAMALVSPYAGARRAWIAGVVFATTAGVWQGATTIQMDLLVAVTTLGVLVPATRILDHGLDPRRGWALVGLAAGIGFLAKGPVAWICPGIALGLYAVVTRRWRELLRPAVGIAALVAILVAAPWYGALAMAGRHDVLHEVLVRQNFARFVEAWDHAQPWWYYVPYLGIDFAPWSWLLPAAVALSGRAPVERRLDRLAWCWLIGIVVFFSLSDSKRSPYVLPAAGAVAVLASAVLARFETGHLTAGRDRFVRAVAAVAAVAALLAGGAALVVLPRRYPEVALAARLLGATMIAGGTIVLGALVGARRGGPSLGRAVIASIAAFYLVVGTVALPAADRYKSARGFCREVAAATADGTEVVSFGLWRWRAEYAYYLGRPISNLTSEDDLRAAWSGPRRIAVIVEEAQIEAFRRIAGDAAPFVTRDEGSRSPRLFINRASTRAT